ncbi:MAG: biopolymer transporter ExbD [Verrucomicrobia bacterium]|nr:biopolymer transporter ExbD [Verrucomicrobiota bacterium]MCF7708981.1 biopolymer transporter ExbD [Verrucomicrobiota bacterium]
MRRFSQRNSLVTLSDINITPLLDLAFVLLIIFIITAPLLEKGIGLNLPEGGKPDTSLEKEDIRTVNVTAQGAYLLGDTPMPLNRVVATLINEYRRNPNLVVYIRADEESRYKFVVQLINLCQRYGITRYSLRTEPERLR